MTANVFLGAQRVGRLVPPDGAGGRVSFSFDEEYLDLERRPTLSRSFEDLDPEADRSFVSETNMLPSFFANALPEGALEKVLKARLRHSPLVDYEMLLRLGADLPGNVRVVREDWAWSPEAEPDEGATSQLQDETDPLRFSLAGVQLKASVLAEAERVTPPLVGEAGNWIAKFPSTAFRDLPENELTLLRWARLAGLDVPDHRLVEVDAIQNLPAEFPRGGRALLVHRYDRAAGAGRIHQEDFAQVFGVEPPDKYISDDLPAGANHAGLGALVRHLCGESDFREYVRRLAFVVLSGNADAHLKNWSLVYPDGIHARLSPLYDVVSTVAYPSIGAALALGLAEPPDAYDLRPVPLTAVTFADFRRLADRAGEPADDIEADVKTFVERARAAWPRVRDDAPDIVREAVDAHLEKTALR